MSFVIVTKGGPLADPDPTYLLARMRARTEFMLRSDDRVGPDAPLEGSAWRIEEVGADPQLATHTPRATPHESPKAKGRHGRGRH